MSLRLAIVSLNDTLTDRLRQIVSGRQTGRRQGYGSRTFIWFLAHSSLSSKAELA